MFPKFLSRLTLSRLYSTVTTEVAEYESVILENTQRTRQHTTPELELSLITPDLPIWHQPGHESILQDPFWAIYWPGGQALTRYILDHPNSFRNRRVFDLGSGCGASALASVMSGASSVIANDIDPMAIRAIEINAKENKVKRIQTSEADFLNFPGNAEAVAKHSDTLLVGDMFYDEVIGDSITALALEFLRLSRDNIVLIGDPGRWFLESEKKRQELPLRCLAKYELPLSVRKENNGLNNGYVYRLGQV